jgi:hypothetical protein
VAGAIFIVATFPALGGVDADPVRMQRVGGSFVDTER